MNIDDNLFEYTGENINLLDSIEIDDLYLDNNENNKNKHINYIPYKGKNLREKLYDMHSTKNLRINTNEKIKKKSSSKPKPPALVSRLPLGIMEKTASPRVQR